MERKILEEYEAKEIERIKKVTENIESKSSLDDPFEILPRLKKFNEPLVVADTNTFFHDGQPLWSQIPFAGCLLIPLQASNEQNFEKAHSISVNDIDKLVDFAKDTNRVKFCFLMNPTKFSDMNHFDPIFEKLGFPPLFNIKPDLYLYKKEIMKYQEEFNTLANINYVNYVGNMASKESQGDLLFNTVLDSGSFVYSILKIQGMDAAAEQIANNLIDNPDFAYFQLTVYGGFTRPMAFPLQLDSNMSRSRFNLSKLAKVDPPPQNLMPVEIGRFLMSKLALHPTTFEACKKVILEYEHYDLYHLMNSMSDTVRHNFTDSMVEKIEELNSAMDYVWKEGKELSSKAGMIDKGIRLTLGVIGATAGTLLTGNPLGLLSSLIPEGLNQTLKYKHFSLGDKAVRKINKNYLVNIYDFQLRHDAKLIKKSENHT